jgi:putative ABC transport system substrate-binding protein
MKRFAIADFRFWIAVPAILAVALAIGLLAVPRAAEAQQAGKVFSLGILSPHPAPRTPEAHARHPALQRLRELGWIEGQNFRVERAHGEGREERLPQLAEELVRRGVDVIWTNGPAAALAAKRATTTIPIVFWGVSFPVEMGLVSSIARPGGNVTGIALSPGMELVGKQLEFLRQIAPAARRLAWILPSEGVGTTGYQAALEEAARGLGFELAIHVVGRSEDFDPVFAAMLAARTQAIATLGNPLTARESKRIVEFANRNRLPSAFGFRVFVQVGGLVSYGPDDIATTRQSALYIDKIFRGARPGDLPVEQASKYELVINQGTAKALGLPVPQSLLLLANEVIQ